MAKKKPDITPMKPSRDLDAFVRGDLATAARRPTRVGGDGEAGPQRSGAGAAKKRLPRGARERKDGTVVRQLTIYLPVDLAKKLAIFCAEHDRETSEVIAEGVSLVVK